MKRIPDTFKYFFIYENRNGYRIALKRLIHYHCVVILKNEEEIGTFDARDLEFMTVYDIYESLFRWLDYGTDDVEVKCEKMMNGKEDLHVRLQLLPMTETEIEIPNLEVYYLNRLIKGD